MEQTEISVVVPLRNERATVLPLTQRVYASLADECGTTELILVDDGSTDETWPQLLEVQRAHSNLRIFRHLRPEGQSAALWTGFRASRGRILATLDGDLQNDPADLPRMLALLTDCDMVCGVRVNRADNMLRRVSSQVARLSVKLVLRADFADPGCNLRVFRRSVLDTLPAFDGMHRFMPMLAQNAGAIIRQVSVSHFPRVAGRPHYGLWNRFGRGIYDLLMVRLYLKRQIGRVEVEAPDEPMHSASPQPLSQPPAAEAKGPGLFSAAVKTDSPRFRGP